MNPLSQKEIASIEKAYLKHNSLREVSRILHVSPNTVKKYASQKMEIKKHNIVKKIHLYDEHLIGLYIGIWMGDGTQYFDEGYRVKICCNKEDKKLNQFIQETLIKLFGKNSALIKVSATKQAYIKFKSKFIFNFVYKYVNHTRNKTKSIQLKDEIDSYSLEFLEGCLLGLVLTDGYLKRKLYFNVISANLASNVIGMLHKLGFNPSCYIHKRARYGWNNLYMVRLNAEESRKLELFLSKILIKLGCEYSFRELKYEPREI
jgi:hypothetical protein